MHPKDFSQGISIISEVFGEAPIKGSRLGRIKAFCDGQLPGDAFIDLCNRICDTYRQAPLPMDFQKGVQDWRKAYHAHHGRQYSEYGNAPVIETSFTKIDCDKCNDLGFVRIQHRNQDDFDSLMLCGCLPAPEGTAIPEWDPQLSGAFSKTLCPVEWFKPTVAENDSDERLHDKIWVKIESWKRRQKSAEKHWRQLRKI